MDMEANIGRILGTTILQNNTLMSKENKPILFNEYLSVYTFLIILYSRVPLQSLKSFCLYLLPFGSAFNPIRLKIFRFIDFMNTFDVS